MSSRFRTWNYIDGSSITEEWSDLLDGEWPFGEATEHVYNMKTKNPLYE